MSKVSTVRETNPAAFNQNVGVSDSASEIREDTKNIRLYLAESITFGEHIAKVMEGLIREKEEHSIDNWDGYGAKAINIDSYGYALNFALSLPSSIPVPEIYVNPDGYVTFEWYEAKRKVFTVIVGNRNELAYAGLYGGSRTYGVEYMYEEIPENIIGNINRLYSE